MNVRMFKSLAACSLAVAAFALPGCTADTAAEGDDVATPELGQSSAAVTTPHWGSFTRSNVCRPDGKRKWSAILWDIPWGASWEAACAKAKGDPNHITPRVPDKCVTSINEWGEWYLPDPACGPTDPTAQFDSFSTTSSVCAGSSAAAVRVTFSAHSEGNACFRMKVGGRPFGYESPATPRICGSGDWSGVVTFRVGDVFASDELPASFAVEGFIDTKTGPLVIPKQLATASDTVSTRICN
jgi:hypothetical protein